MRETSIADILANSIITWKNDIISTSTKRRLKGISAIAHAKQSPDQIPICQLGSTILGITPERFFNMLEPELYPTRKNS